MSFIAYLSVHQAVRCTHSTIGQTKQAYDLNNFYWQFYAHTGERWWAQSIWEVFACDWRQQSIGLYVAARQGPSRLHTGSCGMSITISILNTIQYIVWVQPLLEREYGACSIINKIPHSAIASRLAFYCEISNHTHIHSTDTLFIVCRWRKPLHFKAAGVAVLTRESHIICIT